MTTNEADRGAPRPEGAPVEPVDRRDDATDPAGEGRAVVTDEPAAAERSRGDPDVVSARGSEVAADDTVVHAEPSDMEPLREPATDARSRTEWPLSVDASRYEARWNEIQTGFVDEPRGAVQSAGELLTEVMDDLTRALATELEGLQAHGGAGDRPSTEELRVAFRRYRSIFDRLLTT